MHKKIMLVVLFWILFFNTLTFSMKSPSIGSSEYFQTLEKGDLDEVKRFIELEGPNVTFKDEKGYMPIHVAARFGHLEIVVYLIEKKQVDKNIKMKFHEMTPLHYAAQDGKLDVVEYLIKKGVFIDEYGGSIIKHTALHFACDAEHLNVVKCLVNSGANIHLTINFPKRTALICALNKGATDIVRYLIKKGANVNDEAITTALEYACNQKFSLVRLLVEHGALMDKNMVRLLEEDRLFNENRAKNKKIANYLRHVYSFDKAEDKILILADLLKMENENVDVRHIMNLFFLRMIYFICYKKTDSFSKKTQERLMKEFIKSSGEDCERKGLSIEERFKNVLCVVYNRYCKLCVRLHRLARNGNLLVDAIKECLGIQGKLTSKKYYNALVKKIRGNTFPSPIEKEKIVENLISLRDKEIFKKALYCQLHTKEGAKNIKPDVIIFCKNL